ncbi:hypothetical protein [Mongoliimonas terrestris]|uniref:hypothetical protein n=1 Tax=Mongoliimonas terrestris TaxID=1709001 RepID=UPI0009499B09|nr:hypothetical protein [Mongoliimonas terrestris]
MADEALFSLADQMVEHYKRHDRAQELVNEALPESDLERVTDNAAGFHSQCLDDLRHAIAAFRAETLVGAYVQLMEAHNIASLHIPAREKGDQRRLDALFHSALGVLRQHMAESDFRARHSAEYEMFDPWRALERAEKLAAR